MPKTAKHRLYASSDHSTYTKWPTIYGSDIDLQKYMAFAAVNLCKNLQQ